MKKECLVKNGSMYLTGIKPNGSTSWNKERSQAILVSWETAKELMGKIPDAVALAGHPIFDKGAQYV